MWFTRTAVGMFSATLMIMGSNVVSGDEFPTKPIRIVTSTAGGGTDFVSRLIAQGIAGNLGQQVVVDNRPSAFTGEIVAKAPPDGYTLLLNGTGFWLAPLLQIHPLYDSVKDFAPISLLTSSPNVIVVHPSLPVKSIKELIALAKAGPGQLNYGSSAIGTPSHLGAEMLKSMAGINVVRIPYRGNGTALRALLTGEVQLMVSSAGAVKPYLDSGRLRALAVASAKPSELAPGLPTVAATVPGFQVESTYGLFAPAGTPAAIITLLNADVVRFLNTVVAKKRLFDEGFEVVGTLPEQLAATINSDLRVWGKIIMEAGIHPS